MKYYVIVVKNNIENNHFVFIANKYTMIILMMARIGSNVKIVANGYIVYVLMLIPEHTIINFSSVSGAKLLLIRPEESLVAQQTLSPKKRRITTFYPHLASIGN